MLNKKLYITTATFVVIFGIGLLAGRISIISIQKHQAVVDDRLFNREDNNRWRFISPLLDCGDLKNNSNNNVDDIKNKVEIYISNLSTTNASANEVSVYFRDLNNGPTFGVNETMRFYPASLLKVPLMMSVFKQAMDDHDFLKKTLIFNGPSINGGAYYKASQELRPGGVYTVNDAISSMIKYSDNNASDLLSHTVDTKAISSSFENLGIDFPKDVSYEITVKRYASFFRILYNSTFLNREYSEKALELLADTDFKNGLVAGVPSNVKVTHKFGERQVGDSLKQLHDCGIVYVPNKPYLICVMSRGSDFGTLDDVIAGVSKIIYDGIVNPVE